MKSAHTIVVPEAPYIDIEVTQAIIDEAKERNSSSCMIAQALRHAGASSTNVTAESASFNMAGFRYQYPLPARAAAALIKFDEDKSSVKPFKFRLAAAQGFVRPMKKRLDPKRAGKKRRAKSKTRQQATRSNRRFHGLRMIALKEE